MGAREEEVTYPRDVPLEEGMPPGWKGVERVYGPTSKCAGRTYIRYCSIDGRHKHISSVKQVIQIDCEDKGLDPGPVLAEYLRLQKEARELQKEAKGKLSGGEREEAIARFHARFGALSGPIVSCFPGWVTRWHYQPNCNQVMVEYIDPEGNSWKLLKELEVAFQIKLDKGEGDHIPPLIEAGALRADPTKFAEGSKTARTTGGMYEISADSAGGRSMTQEERDELKQAKQQDLFRHRKKRRIRLLGLSPEGPEQAAWAALESRADVQEALVRFRGLLVRRGFRGDAELLAVHGVGPERRYARRLRGVYYQMGEPVAGQGCYQKLLHFPQARAEVGCDGIYILWNPVQSRWEITTRPSEEGVAIAHSSSGAPGPLAATRGPWRVQDGNNDFQEDVGLAILRPEEPA